MKVMLTMMISVMLMGGMVGCGKTVNQLRADGEAIVDNGGSFIKKIFDAGVAVYQIVKSVVEDSKDNVQTIKEAVTGESAQ